jgi:hypothetical protein
LKKRAAFLVIVFFILSSCSTSPTPQSQNQNDSSASDQENSPTFNEDNGSINPQANLPTNADQNSFASQIQALNVDPNQVRVVSTDQIEWSDTCLGVEQPGVECFPEATQGYLVVMEANGLQFDYHSDQTGSDIQPATPGITWSRVDDEQGYCDTLIFYLPDTAHACWCQSGEMKTATANLLEILSVEEYEQFVDSLRDYEELTINQTLSNGDNSFEVSLTFYGQGEQFPDTERQQSLMVLAQEIFSRITQ